MFCKHKWDLVSEVTTKSKAEDLRNLGNLEIYGRSLQHLSNRKFIQLLKCDSCGKLKRFVENI